VSQNPEPLFVGPVSPLEEAEAELREKIDLQLHSLRWARKETMSLTRKMSQAFTIAALYGAVTAGCAVGAVTVGKHAILMDNQHPDEEHIVAVASQKCLGRVADWSDADFGKRMKECAVKGAPLQSLKVQVGFFALSGVFLIVGGMAGWQAWKKKEDGDEELRKIWDVVKYRKDVHASIRKAHTDISRLIDPLDGASPS
jgi:hypothetical protein